MHLIGVSLDKDKLKKEEKKQLSENDPNLANSSQYNSQQIPENDFLFLVMVFGIFISKNQLV
jgi:hypothetical protein